MFGYVSTQIAYYIDMKYTLILLSVYIGLCDCEGAHNITLPAPGKTGNNTSNFTAACICKDMVKDFKWTYSGNGQLNQHLKELRECGCPEFTEECHRRTYGFTEFTRLTYDRLCNDTLFWRRCQTDLMAIVKSVQIPGRNSTSIYTQLQQMSSTLTQEQILKPCVQVALIDDKSPSDDDFYEVKENQFPFCGQIWCGFKTDAILKYGLSEWTCAPERCKANIIVVMVVVGILAVVVTAANITVLFVFAKNPRLRDSQGIYKMSLAIADALVGVIVLPTTIETMRRAYHPTYFVSEYTNATEIDSFTHPYYNFVGFCTTLCLSGSVYLLMVASFDRFRVVFHPLRYNLHAAKMLAIKLSAVVWVLVLAFAVTPFVFPQSVVYKKVTVIFVCLWTEGDEVFIILACAFVVPLVVVWAINIATYVYSRKNAKARPKIVTNDREVRSVNVENRLAKTLAIMVSAFTVSLVPLVTIILSHFFIDGIDVHKPERLNLDAITTVSSIELVAVIILLSNSFLNFFIYNVRSAEFRKSYRNLCKRAQGKLKSKMFRDSAKEARKRRASAAPSQTSQVQSTHASTLNT